MGDSFFENREKIRAEIYKYAGFVLCTPACMMVFEYLVYENIMGGQHLIFRITLAVGLFYWGLLMLADSTEIMYNIDRAEYYVRFYKKQSQWHLPLFRQFLVLYLGKLQNKST